MVDRDLHIRETEVKQRRARLVPGWVAADWQSEKLKLSNVELIAGTCALDFLLV